MRWCLFAFALDEQSCFPSPLKFSGYKSIAWIHLLVTPTCKIGLIGGSLKRLLVMSFEVRPVLFNVLGCLQAKLYRCRLHRLKNEILDHRLQLTSVRILAILATKLQAGEIAIEGKEEGNR